MVRTIWMFPVALLAAGMIAVGCDSDEDYSELDAEYATLEESTLAAHNEALEGWNEWNADLTSVTVADDWDENHTAAYQTAQTRMNEYKAKLDEGQTQVAQWKTDLEAAKAEGREAYQAKLDEAKTWFNDYNTWLAEYNNDLQAYRDARTNTGEGAEPWWFVMYGPTTDMTTDTVAAADPDGDGVMNEEADGIDDDVEAVKEAGKDVLDKASEAIGDSPND